MRFLRLGNDSGYMEAIDAKEIDIEVLTEGVGPHPLFNGIKQVVIAGLAKPNVTMEDEHVTIRGPGLEATFERASVHNNPNEVIVKLMAIE